MGPLTEAGRRNGSAEARDVRVVFPPRASWIPGRRRGFEVIALDNVSLHVRPGEFVALVGASGCGKTTLLNMFAGLIAATSGEVRVNGRVPSLPAPDVGYMFARAALLPWRSVVRNVELGLEWRPEYPRARRRRRAMELLDLVGLTDFARSYPRQLSQGMQQRANLARTLAPEPSILLMDEPFAALDARTKLHLQQEFLGIWEAAPADSRPTVVFVTHDLQEAILLADRVVVMLPRPGRIAVEHTVPLERPRARQLVELMFMPEFHDLHTELFNRLEAAPIGGSAREAIA